VTIFQLIQKMAITKKQKFIINFSNSSNIKNTPDHFKRHPIKAIFPFIYCYKAHTTTPQKLVKSAAASNNKTTTPVP